MKTAAIELFSPKTSISPNSATHVDDVMKVSDKNWHDAFYKNKTRRGTSNVQATKELMNLLFIYFFTSQSAFNKRFFWSRFWE